MEDFDINWFDVIENLVKKYAHFWEFEKVPMSARLDYIKNSSNVNIQLIYSIGFEEFAKSVLDFPDDESKCKYLLTLYSATQDNVFLCFTYVIKDDFYKMKLRECYGTAEFDKIVPEFTEKSAKYKEIMSKIEEMDNEEEIYKYISTLGDKDIKQLFFYQTEDLSKRMMIVDSMEEDISEDIVDYVKTAQKMILDYFENNSNGLFTEKEKVELQMIFNRTKVMSVDEFDSPTVAGRMDQKDYTLKVKKKVKENPTQMILYLIHEYGHAISHKRFKTADYRTGEQELIEEGMADTFADIVTRSFYEKNGVITISGQEIDLNGATILNYSAYKNHNNVVRTMLYPLEELGQDTEAIFNFYFDNKLKFYELTLGTDYVKKLPTDFNKNPNFVDFSWSEIYNNHKDGYKEINSDSIYAINNEKLNEFSERYNIETENSRQDDSKTQNDDIEKEDEDLIEVIDYYKKYGIDKNEKWETIKKKLMKEQKKWIMRSGSTNEKEVLDVVFQIIDEISEVLVLFKPGNEEKRKKYDLRLEQQIKRGVSNEDTKKETIIKNNRIGLKSIAASIRKNPISLEHLRNVQKQMANQIKQKDISKAHLQVNTVDFKVTEDIEK